MVDGMRGIGGGKEGFHRDLDRLGIWMDRSRLSLCPWRDYRECFLGSTRYMQHTLDTSNVLEPCSKKDSPG